MITIINNLHSKIKAKLTQFDKISLSNISSNEWSFILKEFISGTSGKLSLFDGSSHLIISASSESAQIYYDSLKNLNSHNILLFPEMDYSPYSSIYSSSSDLLQKFRVLDTIISSSISNTAQKPLILIATPEILIERLPPKDFFIKHSLELTVSELISPDQLAQKLVSIGHYPSPTVEEPGTFARRGEIFDIYPISHRPIRIHYYDDMIEEIFEIDLTNQKTQRNKKYQRVRITATPNIFTNADEEYSKNLRSKIPMPSANFKSRYEKRKEIFNDLQNNRLFDDYPKYLPLFFQSHASIFDFLNLSYLHLDEPSIINDRLGEFITDITSEYQAQKDSSDSDILLPAPEELYLNLNLNLNLNMNLDLNKGKIFYLSRIESNTCDTRDTCDISNIKIPIEPSKNYFIRSLGENLGGSLGESRSIEKIAEQKISLESNRFEYIKKFILFIKRDFRDYGDIYIICKNSSSRDEIKYLLETNDFSADILKRITFLDGDISEGFFYSETHSLVLSDTDFFSSQKKAKHKKHFQKKIDLFAEQLGSLKEQDYIIHNSYGIGEYKGLTSLNIGGAQQSDYLIIHYADGDKVYVPVYKMNMVQKYAEAGAKVEIANLKSNKFEKAKERARNSVKKLAFDLLQLEAKRLSTAAFAYSPPDHMFKEFELSFPFKETDDQMKAIDDVINDMQKDHPMDRLVCGDVGLGKTEVAMRAAFKAILDKKQVAILVPTTILALQHFNSFKERFKEFGVNIEFLSRLKTAKETKEIVTKINAGAVDVIIGTHKMLSDSIKFFDLGLVIVDEEQRFGVAHKEKLKFIKSSVDYLTLTATPIPRTLQLSFLGIKNLSIIETPPPKRQAIKTYIVKYDDLTVKSAIEKELKRGGQVFFVHNRVEDIDSVHARIRELVPDARIVTAHGQLPGRELEKRMNDFYSHKYNILVATTIIESGLDIPNANTMIVDRADTYGLSQLHQLRGRIGRSDKKAYAYFLIPSDRALSTIANRRLQALQTYSNLGAGFAIASSDLDIRGAGDILGADQSGHIENIGLELYMQLLEEAISELKKETSPASITDSVEKNRDVEIQTPFPSFIPNTYMADSGTRLKYYKKLSNSHTQDDLLQLRDEIADIFGSIPPELENLLLILEVRTILRHCAITSLIVSKDQIHIKFDQQELNTNSKLRDQIIKIFMSRPKIYKIKPDYSVTYFSKNPVITEKDLLNFSKNVARDIDANT
ncbi:MAG: transcription-repair coupling factor [Oligoflexia bacterium]|nr:transcription-repair coupling factor [Oligoflexia bacterium]